MGDLMKDSEKTVQPPMNERAELCSQIAELKKLIAEMISDTQVLCFSGVKIAFKIYL
jgi:hypothetical protein